MGWQPLIETEMGGEKVRQRSFFERAALRIEKRLEWHEKKCHAEFFQQTEGEGYQTTS